MYGRTAEAAEVTSRREKRTKGGGNGAEGDGKIEAGGVRQRESRLLVPLSGTAARLDAGRWSPEQTLLRLGNVQVCASTISPTDPWQTPLEAGDFPLWRVRGGAAGPRPRLHRPAAQRLAVIGLLPASRHPEPPAGSFPAMIVSVPERDARRPRGERCCRCPWHYGELSRLLEARSWW